MQHLRLESIIQSEVSQKEKDRRQILMHIYGKMALMSLFAGQQETQTQNIRVDAAGGGDAGEGWVALKRIHYHM